MPLVLTAGVSIVLAAVEILLAVTGRSSLGSASMLATGLIAAGLLESVVRLRPQAEERERQAWRWMLLGASIIGASVLLATAVDAFDRRGGDPPGPAGDLIFALGCALACVFVYQGLIFWIQVRTGTSSAGELLNSIGAVLLVVAIGDLLQVHYGRSLHGLEQWQLQAGLLAVGTAIISLGTVLWIVPVAGLAGDLRAWLITLALVGAVAADVVVVLAGSAERLAARPIWLLAGALIAVCVMLEASPEPRPGGLINQSSIFGSLVVLLAGVIILAFESLSGITSRAATVVVLTGVLAASIRILRLVRELSHLATTRHQAMTDELTGIPNRRALLRSIDVALELPSSTCLMIVDLDRFKEINDRYGHAAGDLLLQHVAEVFAGQVPEAGLLARLGGDEFAVLLKDVPTETALEIAQALVLAPTPIEDGEGHILQVGASIGIASTEGTAINGGELLRRADAAMYQAKTSGEGVRVYDEDLDAAAQERLELIEDLHMALEGPAPHNEEMVVYFQPQLEVSSGKVTGAEALVRWQHPRHGLLAPDTFLDLVEETGLMPALTERVLREALAQAERWHKAGHLLRVSVNLSTTSLIDPTLLPLIDEVLFGSIAPEHLVLEVTETTFMSNPEQALMTMQRITERGAGLSIDDYGTGYSSLSYMNDLPATELKIDRSFTTRTISDPRTAAIVAGTAELAHRLGMRLVMEGVEDRATLEMISILGCDESQGYLHSRPLPAEIFFAWLQDKEGDPLTERIALASEPLTG
jgi:diguanylate cyclase (GGDEF)-like protein